MKNSIGSYEQVLEEKRILEEKLFQKELELLKSQLNPHFLFNTLNITRRMAQMEEAMVTEEMLLAISALLRYSLRTSEPFTSLDRELKIVKDYMYIQEKRFGSRISWEIDCQADEKQVEVPVFLLQPLVENAVIHGISMKEDGGKIKIWIRQEDELLHISVEDSGMGMKKEKLQQLQNAIEQNSWEAGSGLGLGNLYRRISAYYEQGDLLLDSKEEEGTTVRLNLGRRK